MSGHFPKKQHYVPQCYLREFVDPSVPVGYEPYVWIFNKGEKKGRKKAPSNIFTETDLYTIKFKSGKNDYSIEETLSNLESRYSGIFRAKIKNHLPLTEEEHIVLCAFVSIMLQRTLRHRDNLERSFGELIQKTKEMEGAHNVAAKQSVEFERRKGDIHKLSLIRLLPELTELLMKMSVAFLIAENGSKYVTSDDPCNLFNPDLQWQKFYGPGLAQKNVQVTIPLSPEIMLCMSWSNLRGYIFWKKDRVQEANRMVVGHCYKYFVSHSPKPKRMWFRRYPLDFFFILKIFSHKIEMSIHKIKGWQMYHNVRKR